MYDKVSFWMERAAAGVDLSAVPGYLDGGDESRDIVTGATRIFGRLGPLSVNIYPHGVSINGSLPKYMTGDNVGTLTRRDTARAVEALCDALHVDINGAMVTGLEFGTNFLMKHPAAAYFPRLGEFPRLQRLEYGGTVYYQGTGRKRPFIVAFYDKGREVEAGGGVVPYGLNADCLLRYEIRLKGKVASRMKRPAVTASTLSDREFYRDMVGLYKETYTNIKKVSIMTDNVERIKTVGDAFNAFVARLINEGGRGQITAFLDELKSAGVFSDRKNYTRLKQRLEEAAAGGGAAATDELIAELDNEVKNAGAYF